MKMNLKDIVIDAGTQSREMINHNTVAEYSEAMIEGSVFPALELYFDGQKHYLVDGFHRYFGYKRFGVDEVEVNVTKGTLRDAQLYALGANDKHGLPRTSADKRKAVLTMLNDFEWSDKTIREIGEACRVSHTLVQKIKSEINKAPVKQIATAKPVAEKPEVTTYKPLEQTIEQQIKSLNEELIEEVEALDESKPLSPTEAEIRSLKLRNNELQNENAELKKELLYWKRKAEKLSKA